MKPPASPQSPTARSTYPPTKAKKPTKPTKSVAAPRTEPLKPRKHSLLAKVGMILAGLVLVFGAGGLFGFGVYRYLDSQKKTNDGRGTDSYAQAPIKPQADLPSPVLPSSEVVPPKKEDPGPPPPPRTEEPPKPDPTPKPETPGPVPRPEAPPKPEPKPEPPPTIEPKPEPPPKPEPKPEPAPKPEPKPEPPPKPEPKPEPPPKPEPKPEPPPEQVTFELPAIGGFAVSPDNATLVVSLTAKTELVFFDTVAGKETKRVTVEFQPSQMVWSAKVLFVAQKSSGQVHILDATSGKELATGNAQNPVRNLVLVKGLCFASTSNRQVYAIDAKGRSIRTAAQGTFIAADPKGAFVCTVIDGRATTDVTKYRVDGAKLAAAGTFRSLRASLINVQAVRISADGKQFGVVAGGGWADQERKRHYSVPLYSTADMKSQLGELETGAFPSSCAVHPVLPLMFACTGKAGSVFHARSYAPVERFEAPRETAGAAEPSVLAFVAKGRKLAWGTSNAGSGVLKFYDLKLTKEQQAALENGFPSN